MKIAIYAAFLLLYSSLALALPKVTLSNFEERSQEVGIGINGIRSDAEVFPYTILESFLEYKTIKFATSKWVCCQEVTDDAKDPFDDWRELYGNNGHKALTQNKNIQAANRMFNQLLRYMVGMNSEHQTIPITKPVTDQRTAADEAGFTKHELCFWSGSRYADKPLPTPTDNTTYIVERESFTAFVKQFGGYSLSNSDWNAARVSLLHSLDDREDFDREAAATGPFYAVGFDSPTKTVGRRNEVWIPRPDGPLNPPHGHGKRVLRASVIQSGEGYELREYKATKWVCTKTPEPVQPGLDEINKWQEEFGYDNPMDVLASHVWENSRYVTMHRKLLRYVLGVNSQHVEIEEALPTIIMHEPQNDGEERIEHQAVCMPLGDEYVHSEPPQPVDDDIHIVYKEAHMAYARPFDGFPLSYDDYYKEYLELVNTLKRNGIKVSSPAWSHGIYNSFFKLKDRRNEVFIGL